MIAIGLVLVVLALLLTVGIAVSSPDPSGAEVFGVAQVELSVGVLFVVGVATGVIAALGLGLLLKGAARKRSGKRATHRKVRDARGEAETLAEQNARLQEELERERSSSGPS